MGILNKSKRQEQKQGDIMGAAESRSGWCCWNFYIVGLVKYEIATVGLTI
jgi:hypothetical protein